MSADMHDAALAIRRIKATLGAMPAGPERDHLLGNFNRLCEKWLLWLSEIGSDNGYYRRQSRSFRPDVRCEHA